MTLIEVVEFIKSAPEVGDYSEAQICHSVIIDTLKILGWSSRQSDIYSQYPIEGSFLDYCLASGDKNKVFVEVKRPRERLSDHEEQLLNYAFKQGVRIAVLTNGLEWRFYLPLSGGSWSDRMFYKANLATENIENLNTYFSMYLSKATILNGDAYLKATQELENKRSAHEIEQTIPRAWDAILSGPDTILVDLISETVEELCGFKPTEDQIASFCTKLRNDPGLTVPIFKPGKKIYPVASTGNSKTVKARFAGSVKDLLEQRLVDPNQEIFRDHLGKHYTARIDPSGHIEFPDGTKYSSVSAAGRHITKSSDRGWTLFFTRARDGKVVSLHDLRVQLNEN